MVARWLTTAGMCLPLVRREISSRISIEVLRSSDEVGSSASRRSGSGISAPPVIDAVGERPRVTMWRPPGTPPYPPFLDFEPVKIGAHASGKNFQNGSHQ